MLELNASMHLQLLIIAISLRTSLVMPTDPCSYMCCHVHSAIVHAGIQPS